MKTKKIVQHPWDQPTGVVMVDGEPHAWVSDHPILPPLIDIEITADYRQEPPAVSGVIELK